MVFEDFTTYLETDPNNGLSVTTNRVTANNILSEDKAYVIKNYGTEHFGDFEHLVTIFGNSTTSPFLYAGLWGLTDTYYTLQEMSDYAEGMTVRAQVNPIGFVRLTVKDFTNGNEESITNLIVDTPYYLIIRRITTAPGESTLTVEIYNNPERTILRATLSIVCSDRRYSTICAYSNYGLPAGNFSGYSENLDLQEPDCELYATQEECLVAGCYWYNGSCHTNPPICEELNNQPDCEAYQCFWYNNSCHAESQIVCESYTTQVECETAGCYWYNGTCHTNLPVCEDLLSQVDCLTYNCYWYNGSCHSTPPTECRTYTTQAECEVAGCYWWNGLCHDMIDCRQINNPADCQNNSCYWYNNECHSTPQAEINWLPIIAAVGTIGVITLVVLVKKRKKKK